MINLTVDENNVLGKFVEEAGKYNVKILSSSKATTSSNGNDMLQLDYEVIDGTYAGGKVRFDNVTWVDDTEENLEKSVKRFNTLLIAAGVPSGTKINAQAGDVIRSLVGRKLNISVDWEENNKGYYNLRVKGHNPFNDNGSEPNGVRRPGDSQSNAKVPVSDPFASSNKTIDISDDDLPF